MTLAQVVYSQVFVGENVYISEGTEVTVKNQDIIVENAIKGSGMIVLRNTTERKSIIKINKEENLRNIIVDNTEKYAVEIDNHTENTTEKVVMQEAVNLPITSTFGLQTIIHSENFYLASLLKFPEINTRNIAKYAKKQPKQQYTNSAQNINQMQINTLFATIDNDTSLYIFIQKPAYGKIYTQQNRYDFTLIDDDIHPPKA